MTDLIVIGGGATGLVAAYLAARSGATVKVLEAGPSVGGLLNTFEVGGNRLEFFYHHFFTHDLELDWMLRELGLQDRLRFHKTSMGVYRNGKVYPFNSPKDLLGFKPLGLMGKLRFGLTSLYLGKSAKWQDLEDVACMDWFRRYAGRQVTESLWEPLLRIKFGPYADKVPVTWMVGRLSQRMNSRKHGDERLGYLDGSLQVLVDALKARLEAMGVEIHLNTPVQSLKTRDGALEAVGTPAGEFAAGKFLYTAPTPFLVPLLEQVGCTSLAAQLAAVRYFGAVCAVVETRKALSDTYWLNIADKGFPFGGVIEHTNFIPPEEYQGLHLTYLSRYFAHEEPIAGWDNHRIEQEMLAGLRRVHPHLDDARVENVRIFRSNTAAVVCDLGFSKRMPHCRTDLDRLFLGTMAHVYPDERSCNNAIRVAVEATRTVGFQVPDVPRGANIAGLIGFDA